MVGVFDNEFDLVDAFDKVKAKGLKIEEVYTPYPVHHILEGMGKKTRITHAAFFYGLFGALGVIGFLYYASVVSWPLHFGGKPFNAFPSFMVITIVATILVVTITTLFTFSARAKIYPGKQIKILDPRATDDKFVMVIDSSKASVDMSEVEALLKENGASEVYVESV